MKRKICQRRRQAVRKGGGRERGHMGGRGRDDRNKGGGREGDRIGGGGKEVERE